MRIILDKHGDKPPTLSCTRDDGSTTWQSYGNQAGFFPIHDLTHFVVETECGFRSAFFGMIAAGRNFNDFGPGDAATFHAEALYAELLTGLLTAAEGHGSILTYRDTVETIDSKTKQAGIPPFSLSEERLMAIRERARELAYEWNRLPTGDKLSLSF